MSTFDLGSLVVVLETHSPFHLVTNPWDHRSGLAFLVHRTVGRPALFLILFRITKYLFEITCTNAGLLHSDTILLMCRTGVRVRRWCINLFILKCNVPSSASECDGSRRPRATGRNFTFVFVLFVLFRLQRLLNVKVTLRSASRRTFVDQHRCDKIPRGGY